MLQALNKYLLWILSGNMWFLWGFKLDIKNNAWVTMNNDFLVTSGVICQCFSTSAEVMSENLWQITSRATKKSLFVVTSVSFYFLYAISCLEHTILLKTIMDHSFHHCSQGGTFLTCDIITLDLWCHANMMWRHIRLLFLHTQIGARAIFTSE